MPTLVYKVANTNIMLEIKARPAPRKARASELALSDKVTALTVNPPTVDTRRNVDRLISPDY